VFSAACNSPRDRIERARLRAAEERPNRAPRRYLLALSPKGGIAVNLVSWLGELAQRRGAERPGRSVIFSAKNNPLRPLPRYVVRHIDRSAIISLDLPPCPAYDFAFEKIRSEDRIGGSLKIGKMAPFPVFPVPGIPNR
jgi:hypothetical protein